MNCSQCDQNSSRRPAVAWLLLATLLGFAVDAGSAPPSPTPVPSAASEARRARPPGVDWFEGDVAQAFVQARMRGAPVFLYFGAAWCPPCQTLKATIFRRPDFLQQLTLFVPVYLDGDAPGAQRWAEEFKVIGYPTVLILGSDRTELERVSGGMDLTRYSEILGLGLSATRPVHAILAGLASDPSKMRLTAGDCRRLAYNGWSLEPGWVYSAAHPGWTAELADDLTRAAERCPPAARVERARLRLAVVAAALNAESARLTGGARPGPQLAAAIAGIRPILEDDALAASAGDELEYLERDFFDAVARLDPGHRSEFEARWSRLMEALARDPRYSPADRLYAIASRIVAAKALEPGGRIPGALRTEALRRVNAALALKVDPYTRTSLVNAAEGILDELDETQRSVALLEAEIRSSATPYYYMSDLAELEEKRGHPDVALDWYGRAYHESRGDATRFQWGSRYLRALVRLRPDDAAVICRVALEVLDDLDGSDRLQGRTRSGLPRLAKALHDWTHEGERAEVTRVIHERMNRICGKIPPADSAQATCREFLSQV